MGLQLRLQPAAVVKGRVDSSSFNKPPQWCWVAFHHIDETRPTVAFAGERAAGVGTQNDMTFETFDLTPGSYHVIVHASFADEWRQFSDPTMSARRSMS